MLHMSTCCTKRYTNFLCNSLSTESTGLVDLRALSCKYVTMRNACFLVKYGTVLRHFQFSWTNSVICNSCWTNIQSNPKGGPGLVSLRWKKAFLPASPISLRSSKPDKWNCTATSDGCHVCFEMTNRSTVGLEEFLDKQFHLRFDACLFHTTKLLHWLYWAAIVFLKVHSWWLFPNNLTSLFLLKSLGNSMLTLFDPSTCPTAGGATFCCPSSLTP